MASGSVAKTGGSVLFLAQDGDGGRFLINVHGLQASRVSTHPIENEWMDYAVVSDAFAFTYQQEGHQFYVLTFPTQGKTWVYDLTTQLWHERSSQKPLGADGRTEGAWTPTCHAYFGGYNIVGGRNNPLLAARLYVLDKDVYTDEIGTIRRVRSSPHTNSNYDFLTCSSVEFVFEPGVGRAAGFTPEEVDPQVTLRVSKDGGRTWGYERRTPIGKQGKYKTRARFNRLGRARDLVLEMSISAPVKPVITGAVAEFTP